MKHLLLISAAFLLNTSAFADSINQSGAGNNAQQNSQNTNINSGNTSNVIGTNAGGTIKTNADSHASANAGAVATGGSSHVGNTSASTGNVSVSSHTPRQANSAPSTFLTSSGGNDSCLGSIGGGVGTGIVNLGLAGTKPDENCIRIKMARELASKGFKNASLAMLCMNEEVAAAMETESGAACPKSPQQIAKLSPSADGEQVIAKSDYVFCNRPADCR